MKDALKKIKLLALDVDGVLTDGRIIIDSNGVETKNFDVQDGMGLMLLKQCGLLTAIISARASGVVAYRAKDLKIDKTYVGIYPKLSAYEQLLQEFKLSDDQVCFVGDDVADLSIMKRCGVAVAVANAVAQVKQVAHYVTTKKGGRGAVRETVELILQAQDFWGPKLYEH